MNSNENRHNHFSKTLDLVPEITRRVRIADILSDGGDTLHMKRRRGGGGGGGGLSAASLQCASPRRIISRCLAALRVKAKEKRAHEETDGVVPARDFAGVLPPAGCSENLPSSVESPASAPESDDSGRCRTDSSFNLGVACGLLYLIGASKNEMNKMVEVRKQMEMLLQNFREELQSKSSPFRTIETSGMNHDCSTSSEPQVSVQMNSPWTTSYVVPESETILDCDGDSSQCVDEIEHRRVKAGMDELEAELEAELELLEINLDTGHSSKIPQQRTLQVDMDSCSSSSVSDSTSSGEVIIDLHEIHSEEQQPVSPFELERKLHELLEIRQQERIQELEEALECTKLRLREKEIEVSWWKDTARIISHHIPESPHIVSQQNPKSLHLIR